MAVGDAPLGQVVRGEFQGDAVAGQYADAIPAQFARQVGEHCSFLIELNAEKAAGKFFDYGSCDFNTIFFTHCPPTAIIAILLRSRPHNGAWRGVVGLSVFWIMLGSLSIENARRLS